MLLLDYKMLSNIMWYFWICICTGTCLSEIVHFFTASFKMGFRRDAADKMKYKHYFALSVSNFCPNDD